eukprot:maker-scaffold1462_size40154-snap-gene-0.11 protein:Tk08139 transcript:maker-scaffold1462_size40154-snap-gene-0.11-mRNA-1 annotation:"acyl-protein thioesterase 1"
MGDLLSKKSTPSRPEASMSQHVTISPKGPHTSTFIFLHGLGDTGHGWASTLAEIRPSHMKIVCPTAPTIPVTLNTGFQMPAWFDLKSLDPNGPEDEEGLRKSKVFVERLIADEIQLGIPASRILLGGFSQGGALALYTGISSQHQLGGLVALSCWLPMSKKFASMLKHADVPVLQCHGDCDPVVPFKWGQMTSSLLKPAMARHEFKTFQGLGHSSSPDELDAIQSFAATTLT